MTKTHPIEDIKKLTDKYTINWKEHIDELIGKDEIIKPDGD